MNNLSLVWIRRDMRLHDHAALHEALQAGGSIQPFFIFDTDILERFSNKKDRRLTFIAETLCQMHAQLKQLGGGILVLHGRAHEIIPKLAQVLGAGQVVCEEDYEPKTIARDAQVKQALGSARRLVQVMDHVLVHPAAALKDDGTPYKVFTPYSKRWRAVLRPESAAQRAVELGGRLAPYTDICKALSETDIVYLKPGEGAAAMLEAIGYELADLGEWRVDNVQERLHQFIQRRLESYKEQRDMVADEGTSKLSPYLRFGLVSVRECYRLAIERPGKGSDTWINELIWREFYQQILYHFPNSQREEFQPQYRELPWQYDGEKWQAFVAGKTGYPIVDAAMRQLTQTGWMHNRARMIVASFLTKDLLMDWRLGEEHFAQYLMDYELASNVGGWQWAASTGTDAQPYFRIFNPELQSKRFDADGMYIKRYVPELAAMDARDIHTPHKAKGLFRAPVYPQPIVDHQVQKEKALSMFKALAKPAA